MFKDWSQQASCQCNIQRLFLHIQPAPQSVSRYSKRISPLSHSQPLPIVLQKLSRCTVQRLLFCGGPSAVFWAVMPIHINAVYAVFWAWPCAHVVKKGVVIIDPSLAHRNATRAVLWIGGVHRIDAPRPHRPPSIILGSLGWVFPFFRGSHTSPKRKPPQPRMVKMRNCGGRPFGFGVSAS